MKKERRCILCNLEESLIENVSTHVTNGTIACWDCNVDKNRGLLTTEQDEKEPVIITYRMADDQFEKIINRLSSMDAELERIKLGIIHGNS